MLTIADGNVLSPLLVSAQPTNVALATVYVSVEPKKHLPVPRRDCVMRPLVVMSVRRGPHLSTNANSVLVSLTATLSGEAVLPASGGMAPSNAAAAAGS